MPVLSTSRFRFGLVVCVFLLTHTTFAQVSIEGVQFQNLNGNLGFGYSAVNAQGEQSNHSLGLNGNLDTNGFFYNPGFLSFQASTYYDRAGSNAQTAALSNAEGYNLGTSIFGGTAFPGYIGFGQNWGDSQNYGLPGLSGLNSNDKNRNFVASWMFKNLPLRNLAVYFADNQNDTNIPGLGFDSSGSTKGFGLATGGYRVAGFLLSAGYQYSLTDVTSNVTGTEDDSLTSHGSSNVFHGMAARSLPWNSNVTLSAYRMMSNGSSEGSSGNSNTDEFDSNLTSHVWRIPISFTASYNDNVYGSVLQQYNQAGQLVDLNFAGPKIGELNLGVSSSYVLPYRVFLTGYVSHQEEYIAGQGYGATAYGGNLSYGLGKYLKGLTLTVGMHDAASEVGNTGAGLVAAANYLRNVGAWRLNANANYNQGMETQLALTTESEATANVGIRRTVADRMSFGATAGYGRSLFSTQQGQSTKTENAGVYLGWMKQTLSGNYGESGGTAIITSAGLVAVTTPGLNTAQITPYSGKSYNVGYANTLIKNLNLSFSWSRFLSTGTGAGLFSNVSAETYLGSATYQYRKIDFIANYSQSHQGASNTSAAPSNITVYYFGISRWFDFF